MTDAVRLHVCITCQGGETLAPGDLPMGRHLHAALAATLAAAPGHPQPIELRETTCLANCERGCSAVLSMPGRWTYLLGRLAPGLAADLADYALTYAASRNGTVMPSRRAPSLRDAVMGRIPPADAAPAGAAPIGTAPIGTARAA